jgi:1-acyl-sn-glycerol-3-phosphate acyltransferase
MLTPRRSKIIFTFFSGLISCLIKRNFKNFRFNQVTLDQNKSVLLLSNHFSWWDGFFLFYLNQIYLRKSFFVMVTEENYKKVWFMKYLGAFAIRANSRRALEALQYAGELLDDPRNLVLIFPQGKLYSQHVAAIDFENGLWKVINSSNKKFQYLFVSILLDYFENRKPSVTCHLETRDSEEFSNIQLIKSAFNSHYETSRQQQNRIKV